VCWVTIVLCPANRDNVGAGQANSHGRSSKLGGRCGGHLTSTIERSMLGGDADCRYHYYSNLFHFDRSEQLAYVSVGLCFIVHK